jgi:DNA ligase-1
MHHNKLYKKTVSGAAQVWWLEQDHNKYRTHSGRDGGMIVTSEWTTAKPKNVGRSNETTANEQASMEIESAYTLKLKSGYFLDRSATEAARAFSPMLAKVYGDYLDDVQKSLDSGTPVLVQPKLDGIRCIANKDGLWSRQGNPIVAVPHIAARLAQLFVSEPDLVLDGELYNHSLRDDFPRLVSLIKKQKPSAKDVAESAALVEYWVYDVPSGGRTSERAARASELDDTVGPPVVSVPTRAVSSIQEIEEAHDSFLREGFEGTMVRLDGPYESKRSKLLLKYKNFVDEEFEVCDIKEGEGNRSGMAGYAVLWLPGGSTFRSNIKGDRNYLRSLLNDRAQYIGGTATVEFFHYTPDGVPRFPRAKAFHAGGHRL